MKHPSMIGAIYGLASAALFGASTPLAKLLLGEIDPWMLAAVLYLGAGIGLAVLLGVQRIQNKRLTETPLRGEDLPWLFGAILAGGVVGPVLLMIGMTTTPASSAALLLNLEGLATLSIAWLVFRESVDARILLGAAAILAGAALLSWGGEVGWLSVGALAIVGACLAWGVDNNLTRNLSHADPVQITLAKGLVAGGINLALALGRGASLPPIDLTLAAGGVGFLGYGVSLVLFVLALRHVGTARTGAYFSAAPFLGAVLGVVLLSEPVTWKVIAAAALMGVGLYLHVVERHDHEHEHEELEHEHAHVHDEHHQHAHRPDVAPDEPHAHSHRHTPLIHSHPHFPDQHHRHGHKNS